MSVMSSRRIAVVCGGPSAEAAVSRSSAAAVAQALRERHSDVRTLELGPDIGAKLREMNADVVFPVLHGPPGEDGSFQGALEILAIPYVGSRVLSSALAMNKAAARNVFAANGIPIAPGVSVRRGGDLADTVDDILDTLGGSVVVKPENQGSALGVTLCETSGDINAALDEAFRFDERVLVERKISGREITVAILERTGVEALPVIEIRTPDQSWYDYEHRYTPGLSEHLIPAPLPADVYDVVADLGRRAHLALGCRDLSRVDLIVPDGAEPVVLEVNTLPGMTPTSLYPDAALKAGISFPQLVSHLIDRALARGHDALALAPR
jgi:D-alanine-D-alanine ligase